MTLQKSIPLALICLLGCNSSSRDESERSSRKADPPSVARSADAVPTIIAVPRPNSGRFTTEQAKALLQQFLDRSIPVQKTDPIVTEWKSPTQGIRIHVTADEKVEIVDYFGKDLTRVDSIEAALDSTMTLGNERSVLLTAVTMGWDSPTKASVVEILFQPSVQIYLVANDK